MSERWEWSVSWWPVRLAAWLLRGLGIVVGVILGAAAALLLVATAQGLLVRGRLGRTRLGPMVPFSGTFGAEHPGSPLALGLMGDSLAVGYGAENPAGTPGVILARGLAAASTRPVVLTNVGEVGAESTALVTQLALLRERATPDVVVIVVGANDVMRLTRLPGALWPLWAVVRELRREGTQVVVATCPDLGTVYTFGQPLRFFEPRVGHRSGHRDVAGRWALGVAGRHTRAAIPGRSGRHVLCTRRPAPLQQRLRGGGFGHPPQRARGGRRRTPRGRAGAPPCVPQGQSPAAGVVGVLRLAAGRRATDGALEHGDGGAAPRDPMRRRP
ncbi:MAG: GDSL-type esterase/lipase family protein [Microbacterium sp.]|uniref:GDSL-type esterase/lipase family protein n=1 Tax=Microbacterium sp. TaxID=51671 RepID=UPI003A88D286